MTIDDGKAGDWYSVSSRFKKKLSLSVLLSYLPFLQVILSFLRWFLMSLDIECLGKACVLNNKCPGKACVLNNVNHIVFGDHYWVFANRVCMCP